tara:strand:- start:10 stop:405 length:396 start_codon:yes stop_codon:yes gene_type:complete
MSTRAQIRFATRETGQSFSQHPEKIHAQFYCHSDGYPEGLGVDIAESISMNNNPSLNWEIEHVQTQHGDLDFVYYIWSDYDKDTCISIFEDNSFPGYCETCEQLVPSKLDECIFVGTPEQLINRYSQTKND